MDRFLNTVDRSSRLLEGFAVLLLFGFCGLMLAEVVARGFFGQSLAYSWEFSAFAMASVFLLASGRAIRTATHVRVSLILEAVPLRMRLVLDILANGIALIIVALIGFALFNALSTSFDRGLVSPTIVSTPLYIPQAVLVLGALQLWFDFLARLIRLLTGREPTLTGADAAPEEVADV